MLTRLKWLLLTSLLKVNAIQEKTMRKGDERPIVVKMDPEQVVETFKSVLYSPYFKDMANQIASKAVEHYISEAMENEAASMKKKDRDSIGRQRLKYSAQLSPIQQRQQQSQQQRLQQQEVGKTHKEVIIEHGEKKNLPAATGMSLPGDKPQSHMSTGDSDTQGQIDNKLKDEEPNKSILSEQVAYALLKDPSPDGDLGLGLDSLEQPTSPKSPPPPKKINGMYYRKRRRRLFSK